MGVPTIKRERESYLLQTLQSLLDGLNAQEKQDVLIVVFVGEVRASFKQYSAGYILLAHSCEIFYLFIYCKITYTYNK